MTRKGPMRPVPAAFVALGLTLVVVVTTLVVITTAAAALVWTLSTLSGSVRSWTLAETAAYVFLFGAGLMVVGFTIDRIVGRVEVDRYEV